MSHDDLEKTTLVHISPLIVLAMSFCVTGIGIVGYLYYSDYLVQQSARDGDILAKSATQKDVTVYQITTIGSPLPVITQSKTSITEAQFNQKNNIFSIDDIFSALWMPLLIIGSYILVHCNKGFVTKVRV